MFLAKRLDAHRAVLANEEASANLGIPADDDPWQMSNAQAWADAGVQTDIHGIPAIQPLIQASSVGPAQTAFGIEILGEAEHEQVAQHVVLARSFDHVEKQAGTAARFFLIGNFQAPTFEKLVEFQGAIPVSDCGCVGWQNQGAGMMAEAEAGVKPAAER